MAITKKQYEQPLTEAANRVLIEIAHILHAYEEEFVVVGGLVPSLITTENNELHIGSIDVDIALDQNISDSGYQSIQELLISHGYQQEEQPFTYSRNVEINNRSIKVKVDFLAGEYGGTGKKHRHQRVQDMRPRKARGCDLAFIDPSIVEIEGELPDGGLDQATLRVASIVPFLIMKAQALKGRIKEKDAYDIYYCLRFYPGGHQALVNAFHQFPPSSLVREGLQILMERYASLEHIGPVFTANFYGAIDPEEKAMIKRDAFERMEALLKALDIKE